METFCAKIIIRGISDIKTQRRGPNYVRRNPAKNVGLELNLNRGVGRGESGDR